MERKKTVQIRVTHYEKQRILNQMKAEGFAKINDWLRHKLLSDELTTEHKVNEIYKQICVKNEPNEKP